MRLYLHIGLPKTGSSAIQSWLSAHSEDLAKVGVTYADLVPKAKLEQISGGNGKHVVRFLGVKWHGERVTPRELTREILETYFDGESTAIISAEAMANARRPRIRQLLKVLDAAGIDVIVLAYIRSIYDHCWSGYQQMVKGAGYHHELAQYAADYPNAQVDAIRRWSSEFDQIRVMNYDSAKHALIESFVQACELELPAGVKTSISRVNRSLSASERSLLIEVNRQTAKRGLDFRALLANPILYANPAAESSFVYDPRVLEILREKYQDDVDWLNRSFLRDDPILIEPSAPPESAAVADEAVRPEVSALIGALLDQIIDPPKFVQEQVAHSQRRGGAGRRGNE